MIIWRNEARPHDLPGPASAEIPPGTVEITRVEEHSGHYHVWYVWYAPVPARRAVTIEIILVESWRAEVWDPEVPSRRGWQVKCSAHGLLGKPRGWAYGTRGVATSVATRHRRSQHKEDA